MEKIKEITQKFLDGEGTLAELSQLYHVDRLDLKKELEAQGYIIKLGYKLSTIIGLKEGVEEYIRNINNNPSLTKICAKYHMTRKTLSDRLKELGYEIINHQNKVKFNQNVFDSIDTEEKAYWLGFIFADGYISSSGYEFELSLAFKDIDHLHKFNIFMEHIFDNVKVNKVKRSGKEYKRCRWTVKNKHLWETLNSYGCIPKKSLVLLFPDTAIFKSKNLIKHFIRGYFDGDGCISYNTKDHKVMSLSILGTEDFLTGIKDSLNLKWNYLLGFNNEQTNLITRTLCINGKNGLEVLFYLYENANCFLQRKYEKYLEYCRLYEKLYRELQTNIGGRL